MGVSGFPDTEAVSKLTIFVAPKPCPVLSIHILELDAEIKLVIVLITLNRSFVLASVALFLL